MFYKEIQWFLPHHCSETDTFVITTRWYLLFAFLQKQRTDSCHPGSLEVNILMCGSELFAYYLWAPAAFLSVMFKHKARSSGLVSHWIPFMKILNLTTNNTALLLRLLLLCVFSALFHFNINSEGPYAGFSCSGLIFVVFVWGSSPLQRAGYPTRRFL